MQLQQKTDLRREGRKSERAGWKSDASEEAKSNHQDIKSRQPVGTSRNKPGGKAPAQ